MDKCQITLGIGVKCPNKATKTYRGYHLCSKHYKDATRADKSLRRLRKPTSKKKRKKRRRKK